MNELGIIIQTYNREERFFKCLFSLLNQSDKNFDIYILDNGSKYSLAISQFIKKYNGEINITHWKIVENIGLVRGRNYIPRSFRNNWIARVDDDDWVPQLFTKRINKAINKGKYDTIILDDLSEPRVSKLLWKCLLLGRTFYYTAPYSVVIKTEEARNNPFPNCIPEDNLFNIFVVNNKAIKFSKAAIIVNNDISISNDEFFYENNLEGVAASAKYWSNKAGELDKKSQKLFLKWIIKSNLFNDVFLNDKCLYPVLKKRFYLRPIFIYAQRKIFRLKNKSSEYNAV